MKRLLFVAVVLAALAGLLAAFAPGGLWGRDYRSVREVEIPFRGGYSDFESQIIRSQRELDDFLARVARKEHPWLRDFALALRGSGVDFDKEALVLVRHTEGSGGIIVEYRRPYTQARKLVCRIDTQGPGETCDFAFYCAAYVVPGDRVDAVRTDVRRDLWTWLSALKW